MVGLWANDGFVNGPKRSKNQPTNVPINPRYRGMLTSDDENGLVYCSDMNIQYGAKTPISDANPTGSRVSSTGLVLSWDGRTLRSGKAKNFADPSGNTDGTLSGGVTVGGATGIRGAATALDGVDDKITYTLPAASYTKFSFRTSFNRKRTTADERLLTLAGGSNLFEVKLGNPGYIFVLGGGASGMTNGNYSALISCPTGWHEYSVNIDTVAGTYSIYLDGALVESRAGVTFPASYGNALTVGASGYAQMDLAEIQMFSDAPIDNVKSRQLYEDTYGWVENRANPHCKDISDQYPLGTDRVSSSGLVLALDMETLTTDGKLKDFSGNGNHATISGAKYQRGAIKNGAYSFSAATDSVNTGITADYGSVTYAFWIRPTNFSSTYDVFGKDAGDNITIEATTGKVQFTSNGTVKATNGLTAGKTAFVVVKVNGSAVTIKVNDTANGSGNVTGRTTSSNPYKLGKFTSTALVGTIGPIFVFGGLTTDSQDTNLFYDSQKMLGLVQGGTTNINVPGQVGQAVDLNGTSQYIEVQDCPALNPAQITAGAWVNQDNASTYPTVIAKLNGNYGFQLFQYIAGKTTFFKGGNGTAISQNESGTTWNFGKWAFIAGIYDGTNVYGFVDGAIGTGTSLSALSHANVPLQIGRGSSSGNYVDGRIAFPFIFNRALSAAEFARLRYLGLSARW